MNVPEAITKEALSVVSSLLPEKSAARYEREYADFKEWQEINNVTVVTENVLLAYFNQLSTRFRPSSLWSKWSMLKSCLEIKENIEVRRFIFILEMLPKKNTFLFVICRFHKLFAFLKRRSERYVPKKAKVLTKEQVEKFLFPYVSLQMLCLLHRQNLQLIFLPPLWLIGQTQATSLQPKNLI